MGQRFASLQVDAARRIGRSGQVQALCAGLQVAAADGLRQAQLAVDIDLDIAAAGRHVAGQLHPHALFGPHQANGARIHATQRGAVDGQLRPGATILGLGGRRQAVGVHVVATGDDVELLRVQLGIDPGTAGDQVELIDVAGIQTGAFDADVPAVHLEAIQQAVVDDRFAGAQGDPGRVDEAAPIAGNAVGVGDDHPRRLTGHFGIALELAPV
ncbi:hypothetical protein D3C77_354340 [compost metagenome]